MHANNSIPLRLGWRFIELYPCFPAYRGPEEASEKETQAIMDFLLLHNETIMTYISLHGYSQLVMTRWPQNRTIIPENDEEAVSFIFIFTIYYLRLHFKNILNIKWLCWVRQELVRRSQTLSTPQAAERMFLVEDLSCYVSLLLS